MTPRALLDRLNRLGIEVAPENGMLRCRAPRGALTPEVQDLISRNKTCLLEHLSPKPIIDETPSVIAPSSTVPTEYSLITSPRALSTIAEEVARADRVALDCETTGLDPIVNEPRLVQLGLPDGRNYIIDLLHTNGLGPLGPALEKATLVGHNLQFDYKFLAHHFGVRPTTLRCTMTASKLINAGVPRKKGYHGLAQVLERALGIKVDKAEQTSDWSGELTPKQLEYAAADVAPLLRLEENLRQRAAEAGLEEVLGLENELIPSVAEMELVGVGIDRDKWEALVQADRDQAEALRDELRNTFGIENPNSHVQVKKALNAQDGIDVEDTKAETLAPFQDRRIVQALGQYRTTSKFVSSEGKAVLRSLDTYGDGRVRGELNPMAAPTGRFGCSRPPLLSLPRRPEIRACVIPAPGYIFINADYSAIEIRVLAAITKDPLLRQVFLDGGDPHRKTASLVSGANEDEIDGDLRKRAKPVNFGFAFGMGIGRFIRYARADFGVVFTQIEARRFKAAYLEGYRGVAQWQARTGRVMPLEVRTRSGRLRRFSSRSKGYCERLNTPVQGSAADGMKAALILLHRRLHVLGARLILTIHDEVLVEAPEEQAEEVLEVVVASMVEGMARFVPEVPIVVEAEIKRTWAGAEG